MMKTSGPPEKKSRYPYPSRFGSHSSMIQDSPENNDKYCVCLDEHGSYLTERAKLDNGMADPNRYGNPARLKRLFANDRNQPA